MKQVENPISYRILFRVSKRKEDKFLKHNVSFTIKFWLSSDRESIEPSYASIDWETAKIEIYDDLMNVYINVKYLSLYEEVLRKLLEDFKKNRYVFTRFNNVLTKLYKKSYLSLRNPLQKHYHLPKNIFY